MGLQMVLQMAETDRRKPETERYGGLFRRSWRKLAAESGAWLNMRAMCIRQQQRCDDPASHYDWLTHMHA